MSRLCQSAMALPESLAGCRLRRVGSSEWRPTGNDCLGLPPKSRPPGGALAAGPRSTQSWGTDQCDALQRHMAAGEHLDRFSAGPGPAQRDLRGGTPGRVIACDTLDAAPDRS